MSLTTSNNPLQPQNQRILDEFDKKLKWHEGRKYLFIENQTLVLKGFFRTLISRLFGLKQAKLVDIAELCHQQQLKAPEKLKKCITKLFNRTVIPFLSSRNSALVDRIATSFQNDLLSDSTMRTLATHFNITKDTYEKIGHSISQLPLPQQERSLLFRSVLQGRYDRSWEKARAALEQIVYFALQKGDYALLSNILSRKNIEKLKKAEEKELPRLLASLQLPSDLLRVDMRVDFSTLAQNLQDFTQDKNYESALRLLDTTISTLEQNYRVYKPTNEELHQLLRALETASSDAVNGQVALFISQLLLKAEYEMKPEAIHEVLRLQQQLKKREREGGYLVEIINNLQIVLKQETTGITQFRLFP
jgi:hypothetical protein